MRRGMNSSPRSKSREEAIQVACAAIRTFLEQRPAACDAFEGVARFWVGGGVSSDVLLAALTKLVTAGELDRINVSGQVHYTLARKQ